MPELIHPDPVAKTFSRHFLQSEPWALFNKAMGHEVINGSGEGWSYQAVVEKPTGLKGSLTSRLYTPYGPTCSDQASFLAATASLRGHAKALKLSYIRVEPRFKTRQPNLSLLGFQRNPRPFQPDNTLIVDLTRTEKEILADFSSTNRNLWNTYERKGVSFRLSYDTKDITLFLDNMNAMARRTGILVHSEHYFKTMLETLMPIKAAGLALAYHEGEAIVAVLFLDDHEGDTRYYSHAGSLDKARQVQANSPLISYLIFDAKNAGRHSFDFYGVSPIDQPNHNWASVSKFKRSFGGEEHAYLGNWEQAISRPRHKLVKVIRKVL